MQRVATCNRRDATHTSVLTRQLGCRASAGPCRLLARVRRRFVARPLRQMVVYHVTLRWSQGCGRETQ
jgi:hypothetical protein